MVLGETIVYVKVGGSFLTYKDKPFSVNYVALSKLVEALSKVYGSVKLILGNGGGSFAHYVVKQMYNQNVEATLVFCQKATRLLNHILVNYLADYGFKVVSIQTSAFMVHNDSSYEVFIEPLLQALRLNLIPVVYGECIYSKTHGFKVVSTEEVFIELSKFIKPERVVLLTDVNGIYDRNPVMHLNAKKFSLINRGNIGSVLNSIKESSISDATGGVYNKVLKMSELSEKTGVKVYIVSGFNVESVVKAILGYNDVDGTIIDMCV